MDIAAMRSITLLIPILVLLNACSTTPIRPAQTSRVLNEDAAAIQYQLVAGAISMIGVPYQYGGTTPDGFDCSGLVQYTYEQVGIMVPRTSFQQFRKSRHIRFADIRPGDLLFFRLKHRGVSHVGIYVGENRFVHAPKTGKEVTYAEIDNAFWRSHLAGVGRFY